MIALHKVGLMLETNNSRWTENIQQERLRSIEVAALWLQRMTCSNILGREPQRSTLVHQTQRQNKTRKLHKMHRSRNWIGSSNVPIPHKDSFQYKNFDEFQLKWMTQKQVAYCKCVKDMLGNSSNTTSSASKSLKKSTVIPIEWVSASYCNVPTLQPGAD